VGALVIGIQRSDKALGFTWGPVGFGDLQASEPLISLRKQSRKQRRPHPLTRFVRDEVLASATNREPRHLPDPGLPVNPERKTKVPRVRTLQTLRRLDTFRSKRLKMLMLLKFLV